MRRLSGLSVYVYTYVSIDARRLSAHLSPSTHTQQRTTAGVNLFLNMDGDPRGSFRFASLQGEVGQELLRVRV